MKRSEVINEIVKKSYTARYKALHEAAKDTKISPGAVPGAAPSAAPGAAGAAGGGSSLVTAKVFILKKLFSDIKKGEIVLLTPDEILRPGVNPEGSIAFKNENAAENAKAADPAYKDAPPGQEIKEAKIENEKAEIEIDPFPGVLVEEGEGWVFKEEPMEELANGSNAALKKEVPGEEKVDAALPYIQIESDEDVYNVVKAKKDNPSGANDWVIVQDNVEEVKGKVKK